ncbi:MAG: cupin domain-containing protein [Chloroflexota bacterium]|nr:cupin domain-containing protein [Chloroflexota bacterium]
MSAERDDQWATSDDTGGGSPFARGVTEPSSEQLAFRPTWARKDDLPRFSPIAGLAMQSVTGGKLMANWVTIEPHRTVPRHQHPHEQLGVMLEGAMELTIGDETRLLRPGDAYTIPPNLPHGAATHEEGCVVLDVFTPPGEDYRPNS